MSLKKGEKGIFTSLRGIDIVMDKTIASASSVSMHYHEQFSDLVRLIMEVSLQMPVLLYATLLPELQSVVQLKPLVAIGRAMN